MTMSAPDLYSRARMPREAVREARLNLRDHFRLSGEVPTELELLNAVGVIALFNEVFGAGAYLELLAISGNLKP